jgi:hypothetical protein
VEDVSFRVVGLPPSSPCIRHRAAYAARTLSKRLATKHSPAGIQNFDASGTALSYASILVAAAPSRSLDVGLLLANFDHMDDDMSYSHRYTCTVARLTHSIQPRLFVAVTWPVHEARCPVES